MKLLAFTGTILIASACRGQSSDDSAAIAPPPAITEHVEALLQDRRFDDAIDYLESQLQAHPKMRSLNLNLGFAYGSKGDHATAMKYFVKELNLDPESWLAISMLGQAHENLGNLEKAHDFYLAWKEKQPDRWEPYYREGRVCLDLGDTECAKAAFEKGLTIHPGSADLLVGKGKVQGLNGDLEGARRTLSQAFMADASHPEANYNLGQVLIQLGEEEQGKRLLEQFRKSAEQQDRIDFLRQSRDLDGGTAPNAFALGEELRKKGQYDAAIAEYEDVIRLDSTLWQPHHRIALIKTRQKDYAAALRSLQKAEALASNVFDVRFDLAKNHALLRQSDEARRWLARARSVRPLNAKETQFIGELFVRTGMVDDGRQTLREWIDKNPSDHESIFVMGLLFHLTDDVMPAEEMYGRASDLAPSEARYRVVHAMSLLATGRSTGVDAVLLGVAAEDIVRSYARYRSLDGAPQLATYLSESLGISVSG